MHCNLVNLKIQNQRSTNYHINRVDDSWEVAKEGQKQTDAEFQLEKQQSDKKQKKDKKKKTKGDSNHTLMPWRRKTPRGGRMIARSTSKTIQPREEHIVAAAVDRD
ncbi:hypothetical protein ZOSMA_324G00140 [Zostera marina]|uniref:Uncharacterized protein n=1 Tax=Zostera marina TaxID=29655 RepID=A0A0K9PAZ2_ZOSMR|nr:hypothetical protein ZOSMA_324G00140 [Zostera marina]